MQYEIVSLPAKKVVGPKARTANTEQDCSAKIGALWGAFMQSETWNAFLRSGGNAPCYGLYTNYSADAQSYDALVGCESKVIPEGFTEIEIPAGKYAKFHFHGDVKLIPMQAWTEIWNMPLPRAFGVDFEEYTSFANDTADIDIYVGLADR